MISEIRVKLQQLVDSVIVDFPRIERAAIAPVDWRSISVSTFIFAERGDRSVPPLSVSLGDVPELKRLLERGEDRLIEDLPNAFAGHDSVHARAIVEAGYRTSLTIPLRDPSQGLGLAFFDSREDAVFKPAVVEALRSRLVPATFLLEQLAYFERTLHHAAHLVSELMLARDLETGKHLIRMAAITRYIAAQTAAHFGLNDVQVQFLAAVAPFHDIGKAAIPDAILSKPGPLTPDEMTIMKTHTVRGAEIFERIRADLPMLGEDQSRMIYDIIRHHHEKFDGTGYPDGLAGEAIPISARIVAVADVFDALASERPYKSPMPVADCARFIAQRRGTHFDPICADALLASMPAVERVMVEYADRPF